MSGFKHGGYEKDINKGTASKFRHGGFEDEDKPVKVSSPQHYQDDEEEESWPSYFGRNIFAKLPKYAYMAGRTGLGTGNILQPLARLMIPDRGVVKADPADLSERKWRNPYYDLPIKDMDLSAAIPFVSAQTAAKEFEAISPRVMSEERSGDAPMEFIMNTLPAFALNWPNSAAKLLSTLAGIGGSYVGGEAGGAVAPYLTKDEDIQDILTQLSGMAGGHYATKGVNTILQRRSGALAPRVEAEEEAFDRQQEQEAREKYEAAKKAYEQEEQQRVSTEKEKIDESYLPAVEEARQEETRTKEQLVKEQEDFRLNKEKRIQQAKNEIDVYDQNLEKLVKQQNEAYENAKQVRNGAIEGDATSVMDAANRAVKVSGLSSADKADVRNIAMGIEESIVNDTITLDKAVELQKNINGQLYPDISTKEGSRRSVSKNFKRAVMPIVEQLNKFIKENGSPEHSEYWEKGENLTREIAEKSKNKKKFVKAKKEQIDKINNEKFSETRKNALEDQHQKAKQNRAQVEREYRTARNKIGPVTWDQLLRSENKQHLLERNFIEASKQPIEHIEKPKGYGENSIKAGLGAVGALFGYLKLGALGGIFGGLGSFIAKNAYNEVQYARKVFKKYPSIKNETYGLIKDATRLTPQRLALRMSSIGNKVQDIYDNMEED